MKSYCTQKNGDCSTCSLVNYGRDCQNNPISRKTEYVQVKVTPEFKKQIQNYCEQTGRTISSLVEWLLKEELKKAAKK